jgi:uncharacterized protein
MAILLLRAGTLLGSVAVILGLIGAPAPRAQLATYTKSELTILAADGKHRFTVEEAKTPQQMTQGLMFRQSLPADAGMLFEFDHLQPASFWMKNTLIPLDMLFIAPDGTIADYHERAVPLSLEAINSDRPVLAVLELNGGTVERLGIKRGDRVLHPFFGNAS